MHRSRRKPVQYAMGVGGISEVLVKLVLNAVDQEKYWVMISAVIVRMALPVVSYSWSAAVFCFSCFRRP